MPDEDKNVGIAALAGAAGAAVGGLVAEPLTGAALAAAAASVLEGILQPAYAAFLDQRAHEWAEFYVRALGTMTAEGAVTEASLRAARDPKFQERTYHALRAVWASTDGAVLPCLAFLAAEHQASGKPVDMRYKRIARFLQDTTRTELETLRRILETLATSFVDSVRVHIIVDVRTKGVLFRREGDKDPVASLSPIDCNILLRRVRDCVLADEHQVWGGATALTFTREQCDDLRRYTVKPLA